MVLNILIPPLAVFRGSGLSRDLATNIFLTILGIIPGVIHALWLARQKPAATNAGRKASVLTATDVFV